MYNTRTKNTISSAKDEIFLKMWFCCYLIKKNEQESLAGRSFREINKLYAFLGPS